VPSGLDDLAARLADASRLRMARALAGEREAPLAGPGAAPPDPVPGPAGLAPFLDHTVLRLDATPADVERACEEALRHGFAGVCVRGEHVARVARLLGAGPARPIAVVDFPLGAGSLRARAEEARRAAERGALEIDAVVALPALLSGDLGRVALDLEALVTAAGGAAVKVILETCRLSGAQKAAGAALAAAAGAAFVKTSTGFGSGGATEEDVRLLRAVVGLSLGVKASGGIRTAQDAQRMLRAGASRIGTSAGVEIVRGPELGR